MDGHILLIDKPKGITSFDVIRRLRQKLGVKKMGHAGTLDPIATGLLIVAVGDATKKLTEYLKLPKVYRATILLGIETTTGDVEGVVIEETTVSEISIPRIEEVLRELEGKVMLPLPRYSAVKIKGKPLYKIARAEDQKGMKSMELPMREMEVLRTELLGVRREDDRMYVEAEFEVGSGTYIRSLAVALGRRLGYPATLGSLRRLSIGTFSVADATML